MASSSPKPQINPSKNQKSSLTPFLCLFLLIVLNIPTTTAAAAATVILLRQNLKPEIPYAQHCNHVVPEPPPPPSSFPDFSSSSSSPSPSLSFQLGYFSGGDQIFNQNPKILSFQSFSSQLTAFHGVHKVQASLFIGNSFGYSIRSIGPVFYGPRGFSKLPDTEIWLSGYWSESTGKLCMIGSEYNHVDSGCMKGFVLQLNYPKNSCIYGSLIGGTLESLNVKEEDDDSKYFEPIEILGLSENPIHEYESDCLSAHGVGDSEHNTSMKLSPTRYHHWGVCFLLKIRTNFYELEYGSDCNGVNCNPFGESIGYLPNRIFYKVLRCENRKKMQMLLGFPNSSYSGIEFPFDPNSMLIAVGAWDKTETRFCGVACRILNGTESWANAFVGDCSIGLSLKVPEGVKLDTWTLRSIVEEIWSKKDVNDSGYFGKIEFRG